MNTYKDYAIKGIDYLTDKASITHYCCLHAKGGDITGCRRNHGNTLQQDNARLSLSRALEAALATHNGTNSITVYEPFTDLHVKLVRANKNSRWYVYGSGKKQLLAASLFGDNTSIIYVG